MDSVTLDRLLILEAGHCFAKFSDGVSIWIGDAGLDCIVIDRQGLQLSYVPQYAPQSRFNIRRRLQMLFSVRNRFHPIPIAISNIIEPDSRLISHIVKWPEYPICSLCKRISDDQVIVHSFCRNYILRIISRNIYIYFPIPVDDGKGSVFIEQIWPTTHCPNSWRHAYNLALQTQNQQLPHFAPEVVIDMSIPKSRKRLQRDLYQNNTSLLSIDSALSDNYAVNVEWMPEAVWHVIDQGSAVSATFAADSSVLRSSDLKFFEHISPWSPTVLYSIEHVAESDLASSPLPIISAMRRSCRLLLHYRAYYLTSEPKFGNSESMAANISSATRHAYSVPAVGDFTCFQDGRVSIRFYDRTIAQLDSLQQRLSIITRDGFEVCASVPYMGLRNELAPYAKCCVEFANWSKLSAEERAENQRLSDEREKQILDLLQRSTDFLNSH